MTTTYEKMADVLVEKFGVDRDELRPDVTFEDLEMDSLFLVEFVLTLQSELGLKIDEDAASPRDTLGAVAEILEAQIARAS